MLSPESQVSPEAQQYLGKRWGTIMVLKNKMKVLVWEYTPKEWECEHYHQREFTVKEQELIEQVGLGNTEKIQAILSNWY